MRLKNRLALVTGAGGGLGGATAKRFAAEGASVMCTDLDQEKLAAMVASINADGGTAEALDVDVGDAQACEQQVTTMVERFDRNDIVANSAGISFRKLVIDTDIEDWERVLRINLTGSFLTAKAAAREMLAQGDGGRIIMLGSIAGQLVNIGSVVYGASKAAIMHVCKVMAVELSEQGIMVNSIAPGPIETGLTPFTEARRALYESRIPTGGLGEADAVADAALFLASDDCKWITGHTLNVDGGFGAAGLSYDLSAK